MNRRNFFRTVAAGTVVGSIKLEAAPVPAPQVIPSPSFNGWYLSLHGSHGEIKYQAYERQRIEGLNGSVVFPECTEGVSVVTRARIIDRKGDTVYDLPLEQPIHVSSGVIPVINYSLSITD